jgi:hypothetical protein
MESLEAMISPPCLRKIWLNVGNGKEGWKNIVVSYKS